MLFMDYSCNIVVNVLLGFIAVLEQRTLNWCCNGQVLCFIWILNSILSPEQCVKQVKVSNTMIGPTMLEGMQDNVVEAVLLNRVKHQV